MEAHIEQQRRNALIEEYQDYVRYVVGYLIHSMNLPADFFDEFLSAGYLGLVEAAERFDPTLGRHFKNFAFLRIRGAIIDSIRTCSELSGKAYRYAKALKAAEELRAALAESSQSSGICDSENTEAKLAAIFDYAAKSVMAYRLTLSECAEEITTEGNFGESPEVLLEEKQKRQNFRDLVATLPKNERLVIEEYYFNDKTFAQIADEAEGLSKSWVSRLHMRGLKHLQEICLMHNIKMEEGFN